MRVIAKRTLLAYAAKHADAQQPLRAWYDEAANAMWKTPQDIKDHYASASFIANNRVVFNIKGNEHRLVVAVAYRFGLVFIKFTGTHKQYDKIDAATVETD